MPSRITMARSCRPSRSCAPTTKRCATASGSSSPPPAINIIRHGYNRLTDVQQAAQIWGVSQNDFLDCINFLALAKYIQLRTIMDKVLVPDFADIEWTLLEVRLTDTGIRVLQGNIKDDMIEV